MSFYVSSPVINAGGFVPSFYSRPAAAFGYLADDAANAATSAGNRADSTSSSPGIVDVVTGALAPAVASGITDSLSDPRTTVAVLKAKIANYEDMKKRLPAMAWWYDNELAKLRARLEAAKKKLALAKEGEGATRQWRTLGQTAGVVGIGVGVAGFLALLAIAASRRG